MGKFSPLLREKLKLVNPSKTLVHLVVEVKREKGDYVVSQLRESGFSVDTSLISTILDKTYIPVAVPAELVPEIAKIEGVEMVHKSLPRAAGGMTVAKIPFFSSVMDELIGEVRIPAVEIPATAFMEALPNPISPLKALGNLAIPFTGINPITNVKIFPTSETFKIVKGDVKTKEGEGITVAILDTGSPRFTTQFLSPSKALSLEEYTVIPEPPSDGQGHGSWCHNCVCGDPAPSPYGTIVGGAPKVSKSIHIKCLNTFPGAGTTEGILKAIEIAVNKGARVISMSLGGPAQGTSAGDDADVECKVVNELSKLEYIFVIAAGNSGSKLFTCGAPGAALMAVTVGSASIIDHYQPAHWSSRVQSDWYGEHKKEFERDLVKYGDMLIKPDCSSLGGGRASPGEVVDEIIWSGESGWAEGMYDGIKDQTGGMHGTSQATPTAAGLIACLLSDGIVKNDLDVKKYLRETSGEYIIRDPINTKEDDEYIAKYGKSFATGWGLMMLKRYKK
ncbi:MAG: S8 family serine peptidase [Methanophagales archaeon]|nr:S8 family serine peptidase [Methanophagales archaeon]